MFKEVWNKDECDKAMKVIEDLKMARKEDIDFNTAVDILLNEMYENIGDKGWETSEDVTKMISRVTKKGPRNKRTKVFMVRDEKYPNFVGTPFWILNSVIRIDDDNKFIEVNNRKFNKIKLISSRRFKETLRKFTNIPFDFYYRSGVLEHPRNLDIDRVHHRDLGNLDVTENDIIWVEFKRSLYLENKKGQTVAV